MTGMIEPRHLTVSLPRVLPCKSDLDYSLQAIEIICAPSGGGARESSGYGKEVNRSHRMRQSLVRSAVDSRACKVFRVTSAQGHKSRHPGWLACFPKVDTRSYAFMP